MLYNFVFSAPLIADFYEQPELTNLSRILFLWLLISSTSIAHSAMLTKKLMIKERMKIEVSALFISGTIGVILAFRGLLIGVLPYKRFLMLLWVVHYVGIM